MATKLATRANSVYELVSSKNQSQDVFESTIEVGWSFFFSIFHLRRNWLVIDQPPFSSRFTDLSLLQWGLKECCEIVMLAWPITSDFTKHLKSLSTVSDEKCWFQTRAHHSDHLWLLLSCNLSIYSNRLRE